MAWSNRTKSIKDVVHGYVSLHADIFKAIIDTPLFQRLRLISQNSYANRVYPGLSHTRFEHSLGVAHAMGKAINELIKNTSILKSAITTYVVENLEPLANAYGIVRQELEECVEKVFNKIIDELHDERVQLAATLAGLLHDIGHVMYSHIGEEALTYAYRVHREILPRDLHMHEVLSWLFSKFLEDKMCKKGSQNDLCYALQRAVSILERAYIKQDKICTITVNVNDCKIDAKDTIDCLLALLLSSTVDIDRADYVVRDSVHAGVPTGIIDLERLLDHMVITTYSPDLKKERNSLKLKMMLVPAVLDKAISAVENLLLARVYMYNDVYLHNVVLSFDALLQHFIYLVLQPIKLARFVELGSENEESENKMHGFQEFCRKTVDVFGRFVCCVNQLIEMLSVTGQPMQEIVENKGKSDKQGKDNYREKLDEAFNNTFDLIVEFLDNGCHLTLTDLTVEQMLTIYSNKRLLTKFLENTRWLRDVYAEKPSLLAATILTAKSLRERKHWDITVLAGESVGQVYAMLKKEPEKLETILTRLESISDELFAVARLVGYRAIGDVYVAVRWLHNLQEREDTSNFRVVTYKIHTIPYAVVSKHLYEHYYAKMIIEVPLHIKDDIEQIADCKNSFYKRMEEGKGRIAFKRGQMVLSVSDCARETYEILRGSGANIEFKQIIDDILFELRSSICKAATALGDILDLISQSVSAG